MTGHRDQQYLSTIKARWGRRRCEKIMKKCRMHRIDLDQCHWSPQNWLADNLFGFNIAQGPKFRNSLLDLEIQQKVSARLFCQGPPENWPESPPVTFKLDQSQVSVKRLVFLCPLVLSNQICTFTGACTTIYCKIVRTTIHGNSCGRCFEIHGLYSKVVWVI